MNLVKTKKKSKYKLKYIICLVIIYLSFSYTFYNMIKGSKAVSNEEFINILVSSGNANILSKYKTTNIINGTMKFLLNIDFTNPKSILNNSILKYGSTKKSTIKHSRWSNNNTKKQQKNNKIRKEKNLWTQNSDGEKITYHKAENEKDEASYVKNEIKKCSGFF